MSQPARNNCKRFALLAVAQASQPASQLQPASSSQPASQPASADRLPVGARRMTVIDPPLRLIHNCFMVLCMFSYIDVVQYDAASHMCALHWALRSGILINSWCVWSLFDVIPPSCQFSKPSGFVISTTPHPAIRYLPFPRSSLVALIVALQLRNIRHHGRRCGS